MSVDYKQRSSWEVAWSVWRAMFIREALQRTMEGRFSWFWILAQPVLQILVFISIRELLGRFRLIAGAEYIPWLVVGMMVFMLFSEGVIRSLGAINANRALLSYRQVQPIDGVLVRIAIEGFLKAVVFLLLIAGFSLFGMQLVPVDPLLAILIWFFTMVLSCALAIIFSVLTSLFSSLSIVIRVLMMPLYFISGVIVPVNYLPRDILAILMFNPVLHLVEIMRYVWFPSYKAVEGVSIVYIFYCATGLLFIGFSSYVITRRRLLAS